MTINPAVSRVRYTRWAIHVGLFAVGTAAGAVASYAVARGLYDLVAIASATTWLVITLPVLALAALRDLGVPAPVPYPGRRQVPEWLRRAVPPGLAAITYGAQLGTGFLTRFTYSTHTAFVALLASQSSSQVVGAGVLAFAFSKSVVLLTALAGTSYREFDRNVLQRHTNRSHQALRLANALLTLAVADALTTNLT